MEKNFLLSVIVPVYNAASYLHKCVDSIIGQTYQNLEIILVVDGGCFDGSAEICKEYSVKDTRIKALDRPHEGLVSARKAGVAAASGEYVAYVDSDDWIERDMYKSLIDAMGGFAPDVLIYGFQQDSNAKSVVRLCGIPAGYYDCSAIREAVYPRLLEIRRTGQPEIYPSVWSKLVKRTLLQQTQMMVPDDVSMGEDLVCMLYTLLSASSIQVSEYAPYHYQVRGDSASMSNRSFQPYQIMFEASYAALENSPMRSLHIDQLYRMLTDYSLLLRYEVFLRPPFSNLPFGNLDHSRVALYGAGKLGQEIYHKTKAVFPERITLWVDQNYEVYQKQGLPVEPIGSLLEQEYDMVIIALLSEQTCEEIKKNLISMGISPAKICCVIVSPELLEAVKKILSGKGGCK